MNNRSHLMECIHLLLKFFQDDKEKVRLWLSLPNPALGGISAYEMVKQGRSHKLHEFIKNAVEGNMP